MSVSQLPNGRQQFISGNGQPLVGGTVATYIPGTLTPKVTYQDSAGTITNANPIVLDSLGSAAIWGNGVYRQIVYDSLGNLIWDEVTNIPTTVTGLDIDYTDSASNSASRSPARIINSIAQLRSSNYVGDGNVFVVSYYGEPSVTGGGLFVYIPTDTTSTDNGGTIIIDSGNNRWYRVCTSPYSVLDWGAKCDGITDDTIPVEEALNWMSTGTTGPVGFGKGGVLRFPAGTSIINDLYISVGGITIEGQGWEEYSGIQGLNPTTGTIGTHGTFLKHTNSSDSCIVITPSGNNVVLRNIAFTQTQPADASGWTPTVYPPTILIDGQPTSLGAGGAVVLEDVFCWLCYEFIRIGSTTGYTAGRTTLKRVWGQPISIGVNVIFSSDTFTMDNIHFWPFAQNIPNISAWIQGNGSAILSIRNDDMLVSNFFAYGYSCGFQFTSSSDGASAGFKISNIQLDSCSNGFLFEESSGNTTGQIVNYYYSGPASNIAGNAAINTTTVNVLQLDLVNFRSTRSGSSVIIASGTADISLTNTRIENWNESGSTAAAFVFNTGTTLTMSGRYTSANGNGGGFTSGSGTFNTSHIN